MNQYSQHNLPPFSETKNQQIYNKHNLLKPISYNHGWKLWKCITVGKTLYCAEF